MSKKMGLDMTNSNLSPENFRSAVENVIQPFVARKKKSLLDQMGAYGVPGMNPAATPAPEPAAATAYIRQADGPNGHKIGQKADGGWYDIQTGAKVQ